MKNKTDSDLPPRSRARYLALHPVTIERTFTDCVMDLKEVIVLDGIDILPDESGFRVRSHDFHGQLPEIVIHDSGNTMEDKESLSREACKLIAIVGLRKEMRRLMRGGKLLLLTKLGDRATVGFKVGRWSWLAEVPFSICRLP
jgi:hypothetical protein